MGTDGPTDQRTNAVSYRGATSRLKTLDDDCPECRTAAHTPQHLFSCPVAPTPLEVLDLWERPCEAATSLSSLPCFSHLPLYDPCTPSPARATSSGGTGLQACCYVAPGPCPSGVSDVKIGFADNKQQQQRRRRRRCWVGSVVSCSANNSYSHRVGKFDSR
jgi:hypothetical protein